MSSKLLTVLSTLAMLAPDTKTSHPDADLESLVRETGLSEDEVRTALLEAHAAGFCARVPDVQPELDSKGNVLVANTVPNPTIQIHQKGLDWLRSQEPPASPT